MMTQRGRRNSLLSGLCCRREENKSGTCCHVVGLLAAGSMLQIDAGKSSWLINTEQSFGASQTQTWRGIRRKRLTQVGVSEDGPRSAVCCRGNLFCLCVDAVCSLVAAHVHKRKPAAGSTCAQRHNVRRRRGTREILRRSLWAWSIKPNNNSNNNVLPILLIIPFDLSEKRYAVRVWKRSQILVWGRKWLCWGEAAERSSPTCLQYVV